MHFLSGNGVGGQIWRARTNGGHGMCCYPHHRDFRNPDACHSRAPTALMQVSTLWRNAAVTAVTPKRDRDVCPNVHTAQALPVQLPFKEEGVCQTDESKRGHSKHSRCPKGHRRCPNWQHRPSTRSRTGVPGSPTRLVLACWRVGGCRAGVFARPPPCYPPLSLVE